MANQSTLNLWTRLSATASGRWLFSQLLCFKAPYFRSIAPRFKELAPGHCVVPVRKRRAVLNHIGTVHAIAMCNAAELAGGVMTEVSIPASVRWIPRGMTVEYLKKATTSVTATARPMNPSFDWAVAGEYLVEVSVTDAGGEAVFKAVISMWVSPRKR
ncbi:hotdog fold domain-containing protein [Stenotrophomonas oahuensis]|uniref:Hotdog fold domain-containing protein n=1 Tax=Stenotrophomonas oahuensis TaxID=3003271 RepID=A0ABY9YNV8_9GAMM|nr:hotdog fold domain-containing protein [Stenotrophomonas sp. A5586]WNH52130.1 hotdog fold domain-containing protein [Stenotrophomonas sp. A5586]